MWKEQALCREGGWPLEFFFEKYEESPEIAKVVDELCRECPFRALCLRTGIQGKEYGVHGGIYLFEGRYSREFNRHKTPEQSRESKKLVQEVKRQML